MFEVKREIKRPRRSPLLALLLIPALLTACSESHRSPTDPEGSPVTMKSASAGSTADLTADKNDHGGHGNPGGNTGGDLALQMQPDVWNTNWSHSSGTVSAMITGSNLNKIDLSSITLSGKTGGTPVTPQRTQLAGNNLRAFFRQSDAIGSLDKPKPGTTVDVTIQLTIDGTSKTLTAHIRIVGPNGGGGGDDGETDLTLEIQPDSWNTNWPRSNGTVSALITGGDLSKVDLKSIVLIGTDAAAAPLSAQRASRSGNHVRAFFSMADAYKTLDTPKPGEKHKITIELSVGGTKTDLTYQIRVVGPNH
jgi:uncharacterized protein YjbI with pentapeptide repeats